MVKIAPKSLKNPLFHVFFWPPNCTNNTCRTCSGSLWRGESMSFLRKFYLVLSLVAFVLYFLTDIQPGPEEYKKIKHTTSAKVFTLHTNKFVQP